MSTPTDHALEALAMALVVLTSPTLCNDHEVRDELVNNIMVTLLEHDKGLRNTAIDSLVASVGASTSAGNSLARMLDPLR